MSSNSSKRKSLGLTITDLFGNSEDLNKKSSPRKSNEIKRRESEDSIKLTKEKDKRKSGLMDYFKKNSSSMPNLPENKKQEKVSLNQKEIEKREELKVVTPSKRKEVSGTILIQKIESKEEQDEFNELKDLLN
jgi:phage/plasmid primase-like uncharacterized protein